MTNARAWLELQDDAGSCSDWLWRFVDAQPVVIRWQSAAEVPPTTPASDAIWKALKARGFKFVGATICYAFMQAVGMVDDHTRDCFRCRERG